MRGNHFYKRLGEKISRARKLHELSQEDLAMLASLDRTYVARIETGRANPSMKVLAKLAKVLKLRVFNLIDGV